MNSKVKSLLKTDQIQNLDFKESFEQLSEEEKNYIYYLSKACWAGQPIVLFQISYESPALFMIFQIFFSSFEDFSEIKPILLRSNISDVNYNYFIRYVAYFYSNFGNYTSSKNKIIPDLSLNDFEEILKLSPSFKDISPIWDIIKYIIYDNTENVIHINLEENNGKNCYYLGWITKDKIIKTDEILKKNNYSLLNTRLLMLNSSKIVSLIGSIEEKQINLDEENILLFGEYSSFLKKINEYLVKAKKYTSKDKEKEIINDYLNFFSTGDMKIHKETQEKWVKLSSSIDFNFGWNETIIDPMGVRGLFEGFVGIVDNFHSQKYEQLLKLLPDLIKELPWDENFEQNFNSIQFNSMEIISFARNGCPFGKSLPNYYEVREKSGVKDILFFNANPNFNWKETDYFFCEENNVELINNFGKQASKIMTSLKQLLGYRHGKLFRKVINSETKEETINFDPGLINPLTGEVIDKYYLNNETFEEKFGNYGPILNECKALLITLYFCGNENIQELFYINKIDYKNVTYAIWVLFFIRGILGLKNYIEKNDTWGNSNSLSSWIIINYFLDTQKEGEEIIKIDLDEEKETFKVHVNKEMILILSANLIVSNLMPKLHIWKCIGDIQSTTEFIKKYSKLDEKFLKIKKILEKEELPKTLFLYNNLIRDEEDGTITYKEYPENLDGIIESNLDRFGTDYNKDVYAQWVKYATNFIKS